MILKRVGTLIAMTFLAACQTTALGLRNDRIGPKPPRGTPIITHPVDGLIVGHRLMAAGEYELALSAYMRAAGKQGMTADVLSALGSANLRLGRLHQAKKLLEIATEKDPKFVPAWNNLGVALMGLGENDEARRVFRNAYALDNGNSEEIRQNLTKAIALAARSAYIKPNDNKFELVRRGNGRYLLLRTPDSKIEQ